MQLKTDYPSVALDGLKADLTQWWIWAWMGSSLLLIFLTPLPVSLVGFLGILGYVIYFVLGTMAVRQMRLYPEDFGDVPLSVQEAATESALHQDDTRAQE